MSGAEWTPVTAVCGCVIARRYSEPGSNLLIVVQRNPLVEIGPDAWVCSLYCGDSRAVERCYAWTDRNAVSWLAEACRGLPEYAPTANRARDALGSLAKI